jgi:hypothetical protein
MTRQPPAPPPKPAPRHLRMVYAMAVGGDTPWERSAARARMAELAERAGLDLGAFMTACGLDPAPYEAAFREDVAENPEMAPLPKPRLRVPAKGSPA